MSADTTAADAVDNSSLVSESSKTVVFADNPEAVPPEKTSSVSKNGQTVVPADKPETVKRKFIAGTVMLIAGIVVLVAVILLIAFNISAKMPIGVLASLIALGSIIIIFAVARFRIEKGKIRERNLFKALTPAQKCLIVFFASFALWLWLPNSETDKPEMLSVILFIICWITFNLSIILAIVRAVRNKIRRNNEASVPLHK